MNKLVLYFEGTEFVRRWLDVIWISTKRTIPTITKRDQYFIKVEIYIHQLSFSLFANKILDESSKTFLWMKKAVSNQTDYCCKTQIMWNFFGSALLKAYAPLWHLPSTFLSPTSTQVVCKKVKHVKMNFWSVKYTLPSLLPLYEH